MPLVSQIDLASLFTAAAEGRVRLVGWGAVSWVHCAVWQSLLPLDYIVDENPAFWGTVNQGYRVDPPSRLDQEEPSAIAVLVYHYIGRSYDRITGSLDRAGFRHLCPGMLEQAFRMVEGGPAEGVPPESPRDDPATLARLRDLVAGYDPGGTMRARAFMALAATEAPWTRFARLLTHRRHHPAPPPRPRHALLLLEGLHPGGAERQLCELAVGLTRSGWTVTLGILHPPPGPERAPHYRERLRDAGIACLSGTTIRDGATLAAALGRNADIALALWHLPPYLAALAFTAVELVEHVRPEVLVAYLDRPNVVGGVAGVLAGVPHILLSGRNVHPGHFPHLFGRQPEHYRKIYRCLTSLPGVGLFANARAAAASYADWLGLSRDRVAVVPNAVAEAILTPVAATAVAAMRTRMAPPGRRILLGVFRLCPEKRPELFLQVLARLLALRPDIHGVICGDGPLRSALTAQATALGLEGHLTLMGVIEEVPVAMRAADLLLHTARFEGMSNVLLEAQAIGLPALSPHIAGTEETLAPEWRRYSLIDDSPDSLAATALHLLEDEGERRLLRDSGREHIRLNGTLTRLVERTLAVAGL